MIDGLHSVSMFSMLWSVSHQSVSMSGKSLWQLLSCTLFWILQLSPVSSEKLSSSVSLEVKLVVVTVVDVVGWSKYQHNNNT